MCLLILIRRPDAEYPLVVASNRDEARDRKASPPGLYVGERKRMLAPRDRVGGGTWMAVNEEGMFAGLTNFAGLPQRDLPSTRGDLPHVVLDHDDVDAGIAAVLSRCAAEPFNPFQLLVANARRAVVVLHHGEGEPDVVEPDDPVLVLTNEHRLGELELPIPDLAPDAPIDVFLGSLKPMLLDAGGVSGHRIMKKGGEYGTVSSSLVAIPAADTLKLLKLRWLYAAGEPDVVQYRDYGNLAKRLVE